MAIGSVGVEVVPDATDFWRRFEAATKAGAASAGRSAGRDFRRGLDEELKRPADIKVKADTKAARSEVAALRNDVNRSSGGMIKNLLALSPALVPLGAAAAAAGAEFVALGGTAALALTGIKREIDSATPVGAQFAGIVANLKGSLHQLQSVASAGVLSGFQNSANQLRAELPQLSQVVASQSVLLGSTAQHLTAGLIGGFQTFAPLLNQVGASIDRVAARFENFATGASGAKFGETLASDYAKVAPIIDDIATAIGNIIAASHGVGLGILTDLGLLANVISSFPTPVLQGIIAAFVTFRAAAVIQGAATSVTTAFTAMGARIQLFGLQNTLAAAEAAASSAAITATADAQALAVTEAQLVQARAILQTQEAAAAATAAVGSSFAAEAEAIAAATRSEITSLEARAIVATATAETSSAAALAAAQAQVAAAARVAAAQRTASAGFASALGPIGLVAAGLLILPSLFSNTSDSADKAKSAIQTYSSALLESNGVINDSVRATIAKNLSDADLAPILAKAGSSIGDVTNRLLGVKKAAGETRVDFYALYKAGQITGREYDHLTSVFHAQKRAFDEARVSAKAQESALLGVGTASGTLGQALNNGNTAIRGYVDAVKTFNSSANTAADRGKLIGEVLRAANGPAITYANAITATATAHQQLVTDIVNAKTGVIDLKTGMLDLTKAGAAPLAGSLKGLQDAAVAAAAATYQLEVNQKGGKAAADDAYKLYVGKTRGALIDEADKLGLSGKAARAFADEYLGIKNAGDLKKKIELIGQDKVETALKGILDDLDILVGKKPLIPIKANGDPALRTVDAVKAKIDRITQGREPNVDVNTAAGAAKLRGLQAQLNALRSKQIDIIFHGIVTGESPSTKSGGDLKIPGGKPISGGARGGTAPEGWFSVGERGPELVRKDGDKVAVFSNEDSKRMISGNLLNVPGFKPGATIPGFAGGTGYSGVDYSGKAGNGAKRSSGKASSGKSGSGSADITYKLLGFQVNGQKFDKLADAREAAVKAFRAQVNFGVKIDKHDLGVFKASLKKDGSDVRDAFNDTFADLRTIGLAKNSPFAKRLQVENNALVVQVNKRNQIADSLKKTQDKYNELYFSVRDAITGSFDITGAGTGFDGTQALSGASIVAQSKQAAAKAKLFVKDIRLLTGKLNGIYLQDLARKGPDALPQAEALVKLPKGDLQVLNQSQSAIAASGKEAGGFVGNNFYGASITTLTKQLASQNKAINNSADRLTKQVERFVDKADSRPVKLVANGREIARVVNEQNKQNKRRG